MAGGKETLVSQSPTKVLIRPPNLTFPLLTTQLARELGPCVSPVSVSFSPACPTPAAAGDLRSAQ